MEENISSTTLIDISRYCSSFAVSFISLFFFFSNENWFRMVIYGHRLNRHVLDRQCKDYFLQHQLVQQILILQFSPHYHYHHLVGHFHQHLLIWILIHLYGRRITEYMPNSTSKINEKISKTCFLRMKKKVKNFLYIVNRRTSVYIHLFTVVDKVPFLCRSRKKGKDKV